MAAHYVRLSLLASAAMMSFTPAFAQNPAATASSAAKRVVSPRGLRAVCPADRLRYAGAGSELHDPERRQRPRSRPGVGKCARQRAASDQQVWRRGRPASADIGDRGRSHRDRGRSEPRHRRAFGPGGQRHPEGDREGLGPVRMVQHLPRALRRARIPRRLYQLFEQGRTGRLHLVGQEWIGARRPRRAGQTLRSRSCPDRDP